MDLYFPDDSNDRRIMLSSKSLSSIASCLVLFSLSVGIHRQASAQDGFPGDRLKELAPPNFAIGGVMGGYDTESLNTPVLDLARSEFNAVTAKAFMPFGPWADPNQPIDTSGLTQNVAWAVQNGMQVHAHVLVYPTENVRLPWFQNLPNEDVEQVLQQYTSTMAGSVSGGVWVWDVVNEVIGDNGDVMDPDGLRMGLGTGENFVPYKEYAAMGPDYISKAFEWAHEADPNALLILNEYSAETVNDKSDRLLALCKRLRDQGVPIDGVGFQNHWLDLRYEPNYDSIRENFQRFANEGFQVFITECDVAAVHTQDPAGSPPSQEQLQRQARVFSNLLQIALEQPACKSFLMWDYTDETSWLQDTDFTLTLADRRPGYSDTVIPPGTSMFATPIAGGDGVVPVSPKLAYLEMQATLLNRSFDTYRVTSGWDWQTSYLARFGQPNSDGQFVPGSDVYAERLDDQSETWSSLKWELERIDASAYRIRNLWGDGADYLTRQPDPNEDPNQILPGGTVGMQTLNQAWTSQQWFFIPAGNGGFRLVNGWAPEDGVLTREAQGLDSVGDYVPGPEVRLHPPADWSSQVWYFHRIGQ